jgi:hypothetical protein
VEPVLTTLRDWLTGKNAPWPKERSLLIVAVKENFLLAFIFELWVTLDCHTQYLLPLLHMGPETRTDSRISFPSDMVERFARPSDHNLRVQESVSELYALDRTKIW